MTPAANETLPESVGPYRVLGLLGRGGMGDVYLCEQHQPIRRRVAVKVMRRGMDSAAALQRFRSEPQWLALMEHSGIARVFDAGVQERGLPWFAMEHVPGVALNDYCRERQLDIRERVELLVAVCGAVQHVHQKGIVHLDLKPSNILVADIDGRPQAKIIDFGVARSLLDPGNDSGFVASPAYMSPEQAGLDASSIDTRSDIYTLGVMLYELLAGRTPFVLPEQGMPLSALRELLHSRAPAPPSRAAAEAAAAHALDCGVANARALARLLRGELDWICLRALAAEPSRRHATAAALADDLRRYLDGRPVSAVRPSRWYALRKLCARYRLSSALALLCAATLLAFSAWSGRQAWELASERDRAQREAMTARESTEFMVDLFALGNPVAGYGGDLSVRQALDIGVQGMRETGETGREVRAETLFNVARVYAGIGQRADAERLLQQVLADPQAAGRVRRAAETLLAQLRSPIPTPPDVHP